MIHVKLPEALAVQSVWVRKGPPAAGATEGQPDRFGVVLAVERARRTVGLWLVIGGVSLPIVIYLAGMAWYIGILGPLIAVGGVFYRLGGAGGYYELRSTGELGEYFGRRPPDMSNMRAER